MTGARGAAGPEPDVRHQPPGSVVDQYFNFVIICIGAASKGDKVAGISARGPGFYSG